MKKFGIFCCVVILIFGVASPTPALNAGTWDLNTNGQWQETVPGQWVGTEFSPQDPPVLSANAFDFQWAVSDLMMIDTYDKPDGTHVNTYAFGTLFLGEEPDLWGESVTVDNVGMVSRGTQSSLGEVNVSMEVFGTYQGLDILISAVFEGLLGVNAYILPGPDFMQFGGVGFQSATLEVVPEPGTMLMFGSGLIGLAVLCRKRFLNR